MLKLLATTAHAHFRKSSFVDEEKWRLYGDETKFLFAKLHYCRYSVAFHNDLEHSSILLRIPKCRKFKIIFRPVRCHAFEGMHPRHYFLPGNTTKNSHFLSLTYWSAKGHQAYQAAEDGKW